ncbi:hypothetical protein B5X24_HaOG207404, partial [Helicoverpa armigera]
KESRTDVQFHLAALRGDCDRLRQLLDTGKVHIDSRDRDGTTPLILSAAMGHTECVRELLVQGADPACSRTCGHQHVARLLLAAGAEPDHVRQDGATPLFKAAHKGHAAVVVELLKYKPNLGLLPNGQSALHGAAMFGQLSCVRLLARRSGLTLRNCAGHTALQAAAAARKNDIVAYLRRLEHELAT